MWCGNASTGTGTCAPHSGNRSSPIEQQGLSLAQEAAQLAQFQHMKWPCHGHGWQPAGSQKFPVMVPVGGLYLQTNV